MKYKALIALFLALTMLFTLAGCGGKEPPAPETTTEAPPETAEPAPVQTDYRNPLTGESGYDEALLSQKGVAIVVENHPQARPQWGFATPDIVMEYEVEGGISRMLWLYANIERVPDKVGPVRSARHDVVELAQGEGLMFVHCGGSPQALNYIKTLGETYSEIDALTQTKYFPRDTSRGVSQEHTLTASQTGLKQAIGDLNVRMARDPEAGPLFDFAAAGETVSPAGGDAKHLRIVYSGSYVYDFDYDAASGKYAARLNDKGQTDENGVNTAYVNVLVLYTEMIDLGDTDHHQDLKLENGGAGLWLSGGKYQDITWRKTSADAPLELFAAEGEPLTLNTGNSYIGFVRSTNAGKTVIN